MNNVGSSALVQTNTKTTFALDKYVKPNYVPIKNVVYENFPIQTSSNSDQGNLSAVCEFQQKQIIELQQRLAAETAQKELAETIVKKHVESILENLMEELFKVLVNDKSLQKRIGLKLDEKDKESYKLFFEKLSAHLRKDLEDINRLDSLKEQDSDLNDLVGSMVVCTPDLDELGPILLQLNHIVSLFKDDGLSKQPQLDPLWQKALLDIATPKNQMTVLSVAGTGAKYTFYALKGCISTFGVLASILTVGGVGYLVLQNSTFTILKYVLPVLLPILFPKLFPKKV